MSDVYKPREPNSKYGQDHKWRAKVKSNQSAKRYQRKVVLEKYSESDSLPIQVPEDILPLFLVVSSPPVVSSENFCHDLGDYVNSRKFIHREKKQEKIEQSELIEHKKIEEEVKVAHFKEIHEEIEEIKENNSIQDEIVESIWGNNVETEKIYVENRVDRIERIEVNEKSGLTPDRNLNEKSGLTPEKNLKNENKKKKPKKKKESKEVLETKEIKEVNEPNKIKEIDQKIPNTISSDSNPESNKEKILNLSKEKTPDAPIKKLETVSYDKSLVLLFSTNSNPFAIAMIATGIEKNDGKIHFPANSKPTQQVWFYKDPENKVQGPFSCLDMFNWIIAKCFPDDLQISFGKTEFAPMNNYFSGSRKLTSEKSITKPEENIEVIKKNSQKTKKPSESSKVKWGSIDQPIISLKDIQSDQLNRKK